MRKAFSKGTKTAICDSLYSMESSRSSMAVRRLLKVCLKFSKSGRRAIWIAVMSSVVSTIGVFVLTLQSSNTEETNAKNHLYGFPDYFFVNRTAAHVSFSLLETSANPTAFANSSKSGISFS